MSCRDVSVIRLDIHHEKTLYQSVSTNKKIMKTIIIFIAAVVVIAGGYAIIRSTSSDSNSSEPLAQETTHVQQQRTQPPASIVRKEPVKPLAPDFTLKDLNNGTITLSSYQGDKPVVLDFFATWCPNCQRDMPILSSLYDKYKDEVEVIGVNMHLYIKMLHLEEVWVQIYQHGNLLIIVTALLLVGTAQ